jgi:hypothetical protein
MHLSDKRRLMYYHFRDDDLMIATYVKSGTTMKFARLSLVAHDLEDCSDPGVLVYLRNVTRR